MKIAVLGTGVVGRSVAAGLADLGHDVTIGTRDPQATLARTEPDMQGTPPFAQWHAQHQGVALAPFADAASGADLLVNASAGLASLDVLEQAGAATLDGVVLLDISYPLDFSQGFPPSLFVKDTDSLAEQIQRAFPGLRVVKSLNTVNAALFAAPGSLGGGDHTVFVSGDDAAAKATVVGLLQELGWSDVLDLGDLTSARGAEMLLPLWLRIMGSLGTPNFNLKVVR
jgi:hypothetical protein